VIREREAPAELTVQRIGGSLALCTGTRIMNAEIRRAEVEFYHRPFARPLPLRSGFITEITEARATVEVRVGGQRATGRGAIYLSDPWAWPNEGLSHERKDAAMRDLCERIAADLPALCGGEPQHPLELGLRLHDRIVAGVPASSAPLLARAVCVSPLDAAIHDAVGLAVRLSAFDLYDEDFPVPSADRLFTGEGVCAAIRRTLRPPVAELPAWLIVGPQMTVEEMRPWVRRRGYRCFKLRIPVEPGPDVARTVEVYEAARSLGVARPRLSVDSNEMHHDSASVMDYLERLGEASLATAAALEYLEQPTHRDIRTYAFDWRPVAALHAVIVDEGLTSIETLEIAKDQGWSGFALKTCKGHSFSLVASAWARVHGLLLTMQDLTNPGLAAIHSALFAARVPALNGIELNSPQFTPAANAEWLPRLSGLLEPTDGVHRLPSGPIYGLGSTL
jgi:L-alanine-DL-glutamate epimerase-like enolase superfamily enzyme